MKSKFFAISTLATSLLVLGILFFNGEAAAKVTNLHELTALNPPAVDCVYNSGTDCRDPATGNIKPDQKNVPPASDVSVAE